MIYPIQYVIYQVSQAKEWLGFSPRHLPDERQMKDHSRIGVHDKKSPQVRPAGEGMRRTRLFAPCLAFMVER
jgi:hypothetical protein